MISQYRLTVCPYPQLYAQQAKTRPKDLRQCSKGENGASVGNQSNGISKQQEKSCQSAGPFAFLLRTSRLHPYPPLNPPYNVSNIPNVGSCCSFLTFLFCLLLSVSFHLPSFSFTICSTAELRTERIKRIIDLNACIARVRWVGGMNSGLSCVLRIESFSRVIERFWVAPYCGGGCGCAECRCG